MQSGNNGVGNLRAGNCAFMPAVSEFKDIGQNLTTSRKAYKGLC